MLPVYMTRFCTRFHWLKKHVLIGVLNADSRVAVIRFPSFLENKYEVSLYAECERLNYGFCSHVYNSGLNIWCRSCGRALILFHLTQVVISHPKYFYLDHSPEPDFDERGLNWAEKYTDIRKTFGYSPLDDQNIMGK